MFTISSGGILASQGLGATSLHLTISRDNTAGEAARQADLFAHLGRRTRDFANGTPIPAFPQMQRHRDNLTNPPAVTMSRDAVSDVDGLGGDEDHWSTLLRARSSHRARDELLSGAERDVLDALEEHRRRRSRAQREVGLDSFVIGGGTPEEADLGKNELDQLYASLGGSGMDEPATSMQRLSHYDEDRDDERLRLREREQRREEREYRDRLRHRFSAPSGIMRKRRTEVLYPEEGRYKWM